MERRLKLLEEKNLFRTVDRDKYSMLFDFYDIETVVDTLIKSSAGVYFFQSDPDPDGLQRKYPLVGIYEDRIFPAASLAIALRHYGVSFDDVEIVPGEYLSFDLYVLALTTLINDLRETFCISHNNFLILRMIYPIPLYL